MIIVTDRFKTKQEILDRFEERKMKTDDSKPYHFNYKGKLIFLSHVLSNLQKWKQGHYKPTKT